MLKWHISDCFNIALNEIYLTCKKIWLFPQIFIHDWGFAYIINEEGCKEDKIKGIVFLMTNSTFLTTIEFKQIVDYTYICSKCKEKSDLLVNYNFDEIEVFCTHTYYFEDEILCLL